MDGGEEALDDNDSDDSTFPVARRRREASDDDDDGVECEDKARSRMIDRGSHSGSGGDSDGLGEAELYEVEKLYEEEGEMDEVEVVAELPESDAEQTGLHGDGKRTKEKMSMEAYLVPKSGSFYCHDDRSRYSGGSGQRRDVLIGGSRLWVTKNEEKWGHDKYEEMMQQDLQHQESNVRSINTGRSLDFRKNQGRNVKGTRNRPHQTSDNHSRASKVVRGRGPLRYKSLSSSKNVIPSRKSKQSGQPLETTSTAVKGALLHNADSYSVQASSMKCISASSSSSGLLHPDGSTNHLSDTWKRDAKHGGTTRFHMMAASLGEDFAMLKPGVFEQGNTVVPADPNKFQFKFAHPVGGHCFTNLPSHSSVRLSPYMGGSSLSLDQGQHLYFQPGTLQSTSVKKSNQHCEFLSQTPAETFAVNPSVPAVLVHLPGGKSRHVSDGKGSGIVQGKERGHLYERDSQNFPNSQAKVPMIQFYEQHHGGLGPLPVCTCLICYDSLFGHGLGNSEMVQKETGTNMDTEGRVSKDNELTNHKASQQKFKFQRPVDSVYVFACASTCMIFPDELCEAKWIDEGLYS